MKSDKPVTALRAQADHMLFYSLKEVTHSPPPCNLLQMDKYTFPDSAVQE